MRRSAPVEVARKHEKLYYIRRHDEGCRLFRLNRATRVEGADVGRPCRAAVHRGRT